MRKYWRQKTPLWRLSHLLCSLKNSGPFIPSLLFLYSMYPVIRELILKDHTSVILLVSVHTIKHEICWLATLYVMLVFHCTTPSNMFLCYNGWSGLILIMSIFLKSWITEHNQWSFLVYKYLLFTPSMVFSGENTTWPTVYMNKKQPTDSDFKWATFWW